MQEYIDNNTDRYQEWKDAVADDGYEDGYETFRDNYDYNYDSWFDYNSEADIYYDSNDGDSETYSYYPSHYASPVHMLDTIINDFNRVLWLKHVTLHHFTRNITSANFIHY